MTNTEHLRCILDYETRSTVSLNSAGAIVYAQHTSTSIFCLGYKTCDNPVRIWIPERAPMPQDLWECFGYGTLVAHNAAFERAITRYVLPRYRTLTAEQKHHLAHILPSQWRCTAAKAAASSLPRSLEMAARVMELPTQKDLHGHKLIQKYSKPRKPSKHNPKTWWDDKKDLRDIYRYCMIDVKAEFELDQALPDLTEDEQRVWELDQKINDRGILIDIPTVKIILQMIREEMHNITAKVVKLSQNTIESATQRAKVLNWVNARGAGMCDLRAETIRDKLLEDTISPPVRQMLEYRQASSRTSTGKYIAMIHAVGEDNRARELLLYGGAVPTFRWAGKRVQPHNFPRPTITNFNSDEAITLIQTGGLSAIRKRYGEHKVMDVLVSSIRGMLIASPGKELFCADFSAVEARIAFWVAGHEEGIEAFRQKRKLYEEMASAAFNIPLQEIKKESIERFVGKESVLGCQYGMGYKKFKMQCHKKGMSSVTDDIAKKAVYAYRRVHFPVPKMWSNLEQAAIRAIRNPGTIYHLHKVSIYVNRNYLNIKLPSGRKMRYFKPRLSQKQLGGGRLSTQIHHWTRDKIGWVETVIWGGVLTNHIVQGIARDLMMSSIFNIENAGYEFILSVHDEALAERKIGCGDLEEYLNLMSGQLPSWAKGAPIQCEGWVGARYRK